MNLDEIPYMREAYDAKKWAFVSDVARLLILYKYGGVYLDTDVELLKPLEEKLLERTFLSSKWANHKYRIGNGNRQKQ